MPRHMPQHIIVALFVFLYRFRHPSDSLRNLFPKLRDIVRNSIIFWKWCTVCGCHVNVYYFWMNWAAFFFKHSIGNIHVKNSEALIIHHSHLWAVGAYQRKCQSNEKLKVFEWFWFKSTRINNSLSYLMLNAQNT